MISSLKIILGITGSDYDLFLGIMALWLLCFIFMSIFNIFHSFFKKVGGW